MATATDTTTLETTVDTSTETTTLDTTDTATDTTTAAPSEEPVKPVDPAAEVLEDNISKARDEGFANGVREQKEFDAANPGA